jgi:hypothetical protein
MKKSMNKSCCVARAFFHVVLYAAIAHAVSLHAASKEISDDWFQQYYQHPSPERFETEVQKLQQRGALSTKNAYYSMAAFSARLFALNGDKVQQWMSVVDRFPEQDRKVFVTALRWADTTNTISLLKQYALARGEFGKYCSQILASVPPDFKTLTDPTPNELDGCWGSFFVTGDKDYVLTVIRCAVAPRKPDSKNVLAQQAARWSLKALCRTHPSVVKIKDQFCATASEEQKKVLDKFL